MKIIVIHSLYTWQAQQTTECQQEVQLRLHVHKYACTYGKTAATIDATKRRNTDIQRLHSAEMERANIQQNRTCHLLLRFLSSGFFRRSSAEKNGETQPQFE